MTNVPLRKQKTPNILGDWDDVRFFLAVAKTGSFSAAATQLNTKQTTVGRRIQALERRLGAKLFDRHRHGMEVTPAARGVLLQAESMMSNAASIERHLAGLDREMSGIVRVAATEGIAAGWLVPQTDRAPPLASRHRRAGDLGRSDPRPRDAPGRSRHPLRAPVLQPAGRRQGRPVRHVDLRRTRLCRAVRHAAVAAGRARSSHRRPHGAAQPAGRCGRGAKWSSRARTSCCAPTRPTRRSRRCASATASRSSRTTP